MSVAMMIIKNVFIFLFCEDIHKAVYICTLYTKVYHINYYICIAKTKQDLAITELKYLQDTLYVISGKWKLQILFTLGNGHKRYRDILKNIPGITSRMLSKELKELELNKIVARKVYSDIPVRIDYEVTDYCKSFDPIIRQMIDWGKAHRVFLKT